MSRTRRHWTAGDVALVFGARGGWGNGVATVGGAKSAEGRLFVVIAPNPTA